MSSGGSYRVWAAAMELVRGFLSFLERSCASECGKVQLSCFARLLRARSGRELWKFWLVIVVLTSVYWVGHLDTKSLCRGQNDVPKRLWNCCFFAATLAPSSSCATNSEKCRRQRNDTAKERGSRGVKAFQVETGVEPARFLRLVIV